MQTKQRLLFHVLLDALIAQIFMCALSAIAMVLGSGIMSGITKDSARARDYKRYASSFGIMTGIMSAAIHFFSTLPIATLQNQNLITMRTRHHPRLHVGIRAVAFIFANICQCVGLGIATLAFNDKKEDLSVSLASFYVGITIVSASAFFITVTRYFLKQMIHQAQTLMFDANNIADIALQHASFRPLPVQGNPPNFQLPPMTAGTQTNSANSSPKPPSHSPSEEKLEREAAQIEMKLQYHPAAGQKN